MRPQQFPEANIHMRGDSIIGADGQPCGNLDVYHDGERQMVSCWKPTIKERLSLLFFGKLWINYMTDSFPPTSVTAVKTYFIKPQEEKQ